MAIVVSVLSGAVTYVVLAVLLFTDMHEFLGRLRSTILFFPIAAVLDLTSEKQSLRIWVWLPSGLAVGSLVYRVLSSY